MKDPYKTLKVHEGVHSRLLSYASKIQLKNGGKRVTICDALNSLLDTADSKEE